MRISLTSYPQYPKTQWLSCITIDQQPGGSASVDVVVLTSAYHARRVRGVAALLLGFYGLSFHVAEVELYLGWLKKRGEAHWVCGKHGEYYSFF